MKPSCVRVHKIPRSTFNCDACSTPFDIRTEKVEIYQGLFHGRNLCRPCRSEFNKAARLIEPNAPLRESGRVGGKGHPFYTICCGYCQKDFEVPYAKRARRYCSRSCQARVSNNHSIKSTSKCLECEKDFSHYGYSKYCSKKCSSGAASRLRLGENNPAWIGGHRGVCAKCGKDFLYKRNGLRKGAVKVFCSLACVRSVDTRKFKRFERVNYPREFRLIKPRIRARDSNACIMCGENNRLEVHHINYNKRDCSDHNLVTLCKRCHTMTHHQRGFWETLFTGLNSRCKVVKKGWGLEIHYVNNDQYCLKHLIFFKGGRFSLHRHDIKQELWFCSWGKFECYLKNGSQEDYFLFKSGDSIELKPGIEHQLQAITNCIITEVSTQDFPEDSVRIAPGDSQATP